MQKKILIIIGAIILVTIVVGGVWYFLTKDSDTPQDTAPAIVNADSPNETTPTGVDLPELPDVVARVDGTEITKAELENVELQIVNSQGIDVSSLALEGKQQLRAQALDSLVSNSLVKKAAAEAGIAATEEDVNAQIELIKAQLPDPTQFDQVLAQQGLTPEKFRANVISDLAIQQYLETTLGLKEIDATDEEVIARYDQEAATATQEMPPLEEIHAQFKGYVIQQKQQTLIVNHLKDLSSKSNIEILI